MDNNRINITLSTTGKSKNWVCRLCK